MVSLYWCNIHYVLYLSHQSLGGPQKVYLFRTSFYRADNKKNRFSYRCSLYGRSRSFSLRSDRTPLSAVPKCPSVSVAPHYWCPKPVLRYLACRSPNYRELSIRNTSSFYLLFRYGRHKEAFRRTGPPAPITNRSISFSPAALQMTSPTDPLPA